jgi:hypothetical protein
MFNTKWRVIFVFFILLIASALIAHHFTGRVFNYHAPLGALKKLYHNVTAQPIMAHSSTLKPAVTKPSLAIQPAMKYSHFHSPQGDTTRCVDVSLGKVKYKRTGDIYTWTDSEGVGHFSDKKPNFAVTTYDPAFSDSLDYFDLTLNTVELPSSFKNELRIKLNTVFKAYGQIIGTDALKKVNLTLTVLPTRRGYERAIKRQGGDPVNTIGMYFHGSNSAFIEYRDAKQAMRTAVHEAVHAINKAILGYTPRWFNEGLAGYFELTKSQMQSGIVEPNSSWLKDKKLANSVFTINGLMGLETSWKQKDTSKLYASSWAAIYFLMDTPAGRQLLKNIMLAEQVSPCNRLSEKQLKKRLFQQFPDIKRRYSQWLKTPFKTHNF